MSKDMYIYCAPTDFVTIGKLPYLYNPFEEFPPPNFTHFLVADSVPPQYVGTKN